MKPDNKKLLLAQEQRIKVYCLRKYSTCNIPYILVCCNYEKGAMVGDRRMVSRRIVESARFLKMPATSQNLYFHLIVNADDDGVVEAYPVLALTKANEDDLRVLISKRFIFVLDEDLVVFIEDWLEQNTIRADRKIDSRYKPLLLQSRPDIQLIERKERSDRKRKKCGQSLDGPRTAQYNLSESNLNQGNLITQSINCEEKGVIDRLTEIENYRENIASNIELDSLLDMARQKDSCEVAMVNEIYESICDMVTMPRKKVVIKQIEYPWKVVRGQFLKLKMGHVANILNRIVDADLGIKDMGAYLTSTLYNESLNGTIAEQAELHDSYLKHLRGTPYSI